MSLYNTDEKENRLPKAVIAGLRSAYRNNSDNDFKSDFDHSMIEMKALVEACDMEVCASVSQTLDHPDNATYIGKGKAHEIAELIELNHAEYCIFESNLSPSQMKNLQEIVGVPVWDRTNLILEIFSRRAKTRESRLQVESAYLQYMLPRLTGMWQHLGRQGGGSGSRSNKGIGETQIELDRRHINHRIAELSKELEVISRTRDVQRAGRNRGDLPSVALVGYTNAGKSSLMNRLLSMSAELTNTSGNASGSTSGGAVYSTDSSSPEGIISASDKLEPKLVFEKNMLFATLDTSIRRIYTDDHQDFLLSDTVGFIENLPHGLVKAFRSTLDEVKYANLLLIVLDSSDPYHKQHRAVTENTLKDLEAGDIPRIYVMNKSDLLPPDELRPIKANDNTIYISTRTGSGIDELLATIKGAVYSNRRTFKVLLPYSRGDLTDKIHRLGRTDSEEYTGDGILISGECPGRLFDELKDFVIE